MRYYTMIFRYSMFLNILLISLIFFHYFFFLIISYYHQKILLFKDMLRERILKLIFESVMKSEEGNMFLMYSKKYF